MRVGKVAKFESALNFLTFRFNIILISNVLSLSLKLNFNLIQIVIQEVTDLGVWVGSAPDSTLLIGAMTWSSKPALRSELLLPIDLENKKSLK